MEKKCALRGAQDPLVGIAYYVWHSYFLVWIVHDDKQQRSCRLISVGIANLTYESTEPRIYDVQQIPDRCSNRKDVWRYNHGL